MLPRSAGRALTNSSRLLRVTSRSPVLLVRRDPYNQFRRNKTGQDSEPGRRRPRDGADGKERLARDEASSSEPMTHESVETSHAGSEHRSKLRQASETPDSTVTENETSSVLQGTTAPLPDLRQGIPSTFEQEFSDRSSSFKSEHPSSQSLNLTEDPAAGGGRGRDQDNASSDAHLTSIERRRLRMARYLYITAAAGALAGAVLMGQNWETKEEEEKHPEAPNGWSLYSFYYRIRARLSDSLGYYTDPAFDKLLPDQTPDFIPPGTPTLVLSLEDLLLHSKWTRQNGWEVAKRPGVDYFLRYLSQYYELVIFTTVLRMNAELVIQKLDPYHVVQWPLYREATRYVNGEPVKDLSNLNRDLSRTIVIDTVPSHLQLQPENAVILPKWKGSKNDPHTNDLIAMIPFLEYLATMNTDDYRKVIKSYEGTHLPTEFMKREAEARERFKSIRSTQQGKQRSSGASWFANALGFKSGAGGPMGGPMLPPGSLPGEQSMEEALRQGKTLADMYRERGQRGYERLEEEIRESGDKLLQAMEEENKKAQEEALKGAQDSVRNMWGSFFGLFGAGDKGDNSNEGQST